MKEITTPISLQSHLFGFLQFSLDINVSYHFQIFNRFSSFDNYKITIRNYNKKLQLQTTLCQVSAHTHTHLHMHPDAAAAAALMMQHPGFPGRGDISRGLTNDPNLLTSTLQPRLCPATAHRPDHLTWLLGSGPRPRPLGSGRTIFRG